MTARGPLYSRGLLSRNLFYKTSAREPAYILQMLDQKATGMPSPETYRRRRWRLYLILLLPSPEKRGCEVVMSEFAGPWCQDEKLWQVGDEGAHFQCRVMDRLVSNNVRRKREISSTTICIKINVKSMCMMKDAKGETKKTRRTKDAKD